MTAIERLLAAFDVQVEPFAICDVRGGLDMLLEPIGQVTVHYALRGTGALHVGTEERFAIAPGTMVIVPAGLTQRIESTGDEHLSGAEDARCVSLPEGMRWLQAGSGAPEILMACGRIRASYGEGTGIFDLLHRPIVESFPSEHPIHPAFQTLLAELSMPQLGTKALAEALMKQCLIMVLRRLAKRQDARLPWLAALHDLRLAMAVETILSHPEGTHTVEDMAARAGMSRSSFCAHFGQAFGRSPHAFLTENRLRRAARLLQTTEVPVKTIAARIGYRSRSNFSRAFKALYGLDPIAYRQAATATGDA